MATVLQNEKVFWVQKWSKSDRFGHLAVKNQQIWSKMGPQKNSHFAIQRPSQLGPQNRNPQCTDHFEGSKKWQGVGGVALLRFRQYQICSIFGTPKKFLILQCSSHLNSDPKIEIPNGANILRGPKSGKG